MIDERELDFLKCHKLNKSYKFVSNFRNYLTELYFSAPTGTLIVRTLLVFLPLLNCISKDLKFSKIVKKSLEI
jgi:hypothetical protein